MTHGAGSRTWLQCVQQDSWLLYFLHTPPTHLFYYPFACSPSLPLFLSLTHTCIHIHTDANMHSHALALTNTPEGPAGQRVMTENSWSKSSQLHSEKRSCLETSQHQAQTPVSQTQQQEKNLLNCTTLKLHYNHNKRNITTLCIVKLIVVNKPCLNYYLFNKEMFKSN